MGKKKKSLALIISVETVTWTFFTSIVKETSDNVTFFYFSSTKLEHKYNFLNYYRKYFCFI